MLGQDFAVTSQLASRDPSGCILGLCDVVSRMVPRKQLMLMFNGILAIQNLGNSKPGFSL
jgi:hypothetical protein